LVLKVFQLFHPRHPHVSTFLPQGKSRRRSSESRNLCWGKEIQEVQSVVKRHSTNPFEV
jgi:hypothetical protein